MTMILIESISRDMNEVAELFDPLKLLGLVDWPSRDVTVYFKKIFTF